MKRFGLIIFLFIHLIVAQARNYIVIDSTLVKNTRIDSLIEPYKKLVDQKMNNIIGYNQTTLEKPLLGQFAVDALKEQVKIKLTAEQKKGRKNIKLPEIAFLTPGGLRRNIYAGNITVGDIYELMPFENKIALIPANYQEINCLVDFILKSKSQSIYLSGMYVQEQPLKILINGKALKKDKKYLISTIDYLALGGDNMTCFINNSGMNIQEDLLFRDLLLDYVTSNKILNIQAEKRIQFKQ